MCANCDAFARLIASALFFMIFIFLTSPFDADVFTGKTEPISNVKKPATQIAGQGAFVVIHNTSIDAIRLVNALLKNGKDVSMLTDNIPGAKGGDFVMKRADMSMPEIGIDALLVQGLDAGDSLPVVAQKLIRPRITVLGASNPFRFAMSEMGFEEGTDYFAGTATNHMENTEDGMTLGYTVAANQESAGVNIVISGIQFPELFPSFAFRFSKTVS